jgi:Galactosyltransferase
MSLFNNTRLWQGVSVLSILSLVLYTSLPVLFDFESDSVYTQHIWKVPPTAASAAPGASESAVVTAAAPVTTSTDSDSPNTHLVSTIIPETPHTTSQTSRINSDSDGDTETDSESQSQQTPRLRVVSDDHTAHATGTHDKISDKLCDTATSTTQSLLLSEENRCYGSCVPLILNSPPFIPISDALDNAAYLQEGRESQKQASALWLDKRGCIESMKASARAARQFNPDSRIYMLSVMQNPEYLCDDAGLMDSLAKHYGLEIVTFSTTDELIRKHADISQLLKQFLSVCDGHLDHPSTRHAMQWFHTLALLRERNHNMAFFLDHDHLILDHIHEVYSAYGMTGFQASVTAGDSLASSFISEPFVTALVTRMVALIDGNAKCLPFEYGTEFHQSLPRQAAIQLQRTFQDHELIKVQNTAMIRPCSLQGFPWPDSSSTKLSLSDDPPTDPLLWECGSMDDVARVAIKQQSNAEPQVSLRAFARDLHGSHVYAQPHSNRKTDREFLVRVTDSFHCSEAGASHDSKSTRHKHIRFIEGRVCAILENDSKFVPSSHRFSSELAYVKLDVIGFKTFRCPLQIMSFLHAIERSAAGTAFECRASLSNIDYRQCLRTGNNGVDRVNTPLLMQVPKGEHHEGASAMAAKVSFGKEILPKVQSSDYAPLDFGKHVAVVIFTYQERFDIVRSLYSSGGWLRSFPPAVLIVASHQVFEPGAHELGDNLHILNLDPVEDDGRAQVFKLKAVLNYAATSILPKYPDVKWVAKIDDDTFLNVALLQDSLAKVAAATGSEHQVGIYVGACSCTTPLDHQTSFGCGSAFSCTPPTFVRGLPFACGGPGYFLSRKSIEILHEQYDESRCYMGSEDVGLAQCLWRIAQIPCLLPPTGDDAFLFRRSVSDLLQHLDNDDPLDPQSLFNTVLGVHTGYDQDTFPLQALAQLNAHFRGAEYHRRKAKEAASQIAD